MRPCRRNTLKLTAPSDFIVSCQQREHLIATWNNDKTDTNQ